VVSRAFTYDLYAAFLESAMDAIRRLHDAGAKIVIGSDTVYSEQTLYAFHGYSTLREIELAVQAGLTPMEALQAATINAAEMLGLEDEIGTVAAGKRADLVIMRDDPLADIENIKSILWTVQDGIAKTPQQWMSDSSTDE